MDNITTQKLLNESVALVFKAKASAIEQYNNYLKNLDPDIRAVLYVRSDDSIREMRSSEYAALMDGLPEDDMSDDTLFGADSINALSHFKFFFGGGKTI